MSDEQMLAIGMDPDTKSTGIAAVQSFNGGFQIVQVALVRAKGRKAADRRIEMALGLISFAFNCLYKPTAIAVEWQHIRPGSEKRPNDILNLTGISGMCVAAAAQLNSEHLFTPIPSEWKKQVPKHIHQARVCSRLHITTELRSTEGEKNFIPGAEDIPASMRSHVIDALGLAVWALDPYGPIYDARLTARVKKR